MIGKITKGKSFASLCEYILQKEQAELLCTNMAGSSPKHFAKQLAATCQLNPRVKYPVAHFSISFAPREKPSKRQLSKIVKEYLQGMGFTDNLYFAATHSDCPHFHLHIAASRITLSGKCVDGWKDRLRSEKILRRLEKDCGLTITPCSWEVTNSSPTTGQKRRHSREQEEFNRGLRNIPPQPSILEKLQKAIASAITPGMSMTEFLSKLTEMGVSPRIKLSDTGIIQGISYGLDGVAFPGRKLGRNQGDCTLLGLQVRGIKFNLHTDAPALAYHSNLDPKTINQLIAEIPHNPNNQHLLFPKQELKITAKKVYSLSKSLEMEIG